MRIATVRILIACLIFCTTLPCIAGWFSRSCSKCGCGELEKVCRVVPDVKKVTETKFVVDCEDICLPGKSCTEERMVSDTCVAGGQRCEKVSVPTCDRIVTKKKLKKGHHHRRQTGLEMRCGHHLQPMRSQLRHRQLRKIAVSNALLPLHFRQIATT